MPKQKTAAYTAAAVAMSESLRAMIDTANLVVSRWSDGDLAGAVNELESVAGEARETLHKAVRGVEFKRDKKMRELVGIIARMKTLSEFGENQPGNDDYVDTVDNLIAMAREAERG